jgi:uncharacterized protein (DUF488 family)
VSEPRTLLLYGYSGRRPEDLLDAVTQLGAVLWDIRYSPKSRNPAWSGKHLAALFGDRYHHVPSFGNESYRTSNIRLHNPVKGLALFDQESRPIVLMCVCPITARCHRATAAAYITQRRTVTVDELDDALAALQNDLSTQTRLFEER